MTGNQIYAQKEGRRLKARAELLRRSSLGVDRNTTFEEWYAALTDELGPEGVVRWDIGYEVLKAAWEAGVKVGLDINY